MSDTGATRTLPTREGYDRWAALYDRDGNPLVLLEERTIPAFLGDVQGLTVADIGCGTGRHAVMLAASGANVTALDFSDGMLAAAAGKPGADRVRWVQHDIARPLPLPDRAFDLVLCCLVLDHIEDVAGLFGSSGGSATGPSW
jgi:malonyl-CoA O-methyltransferase